MITLSASAKIQIIVSKPLQKHSIHFYYVFFDITTSAEKLVGEKGKYFDNNYYVFIILKTRITYLLYNIYCIVALCSEKKLSWF